MSVIHSRDLLATLHLLVAMVKCFHPDLELPSNVSVEVVLVEVSLDLISSASAEARFQRDLILYLEPGDLEVMTSSS